MANINFDYDAVFDCAKRIKKMAESVEYEGNKIATVITTVQSGWTGTGSAEYINYLETVRKEIYNRSDRLYHIAAALEGSANDARNADREAARQIAAAEAVASAQYQQSQTASSSNTAQPKSVLADAVSDSLKDTVNIIKDAADKAKRKGAKR